MALIELSDSDVRDKLLQALAGSRGYLEKVQKELLAVKSTPEVLGTLMILNQLLNPVYSVVAGVEAQAAQVRRPKITPGGWVN